MELRSSARNKEKGTSNRRAAALVGKRKLSYDVGDEDKGVAELGFEPMKIRPRACASKAKRSRGDNRLSQSIQTDSLDYRGDSGGLMSDIIGSDSEGEGHKPTPKRERPKRPILDNFFGGRIITGVNLFRCNVQTAFLELDALQFTERHYELLRRTPFWFFIKGLKEIYPLAKFQGMCMKSEEALRRILENWDKHKKCLVLAKLEGRLTRRDVQLIFGVVAGSYIIPLKVGPGGEKAQWLRRCFEAQMGRNFVLKKSCFLKKINALLHKEDETSVADVARLVVCYLLATVFAPNQNVAIPFHVADYVEDISKMCQYDWATYILDMLTDQLFNSTNMHAGGCVMLFAYWLLEHSTLVKPEPGIAFPRCLRWDLCKLYEELMRRQLWEIPRSLLRFGRLEATETERLAFREVVTSLPAAIEDCVRVMSPGQAPRKRVRIETGAVGMADTGVVNGAEVDGASSDDGMYQTPEQVAATQGSMSLGFTDEIEKCVGGVGSVGSDNISNKNGEDLVEGPNVVDGNVSEESPVCNQLGRRRSEVSRRNVVIAGRVGQSTKETVLSSVCSQTAQRRVLRSGSKAPANKPVLIASTTQEGCLVGEVTPPQVNMWTSAEDVGVVGLTPVPVFAEVPGEQKALKSKLKEVEQVAKSMEAEVMSLGLTVIEKDAAIVALKKQMVTLMEQHKLEVEQLKGMAETGGKEVPDDITGVESIPESSKVQALEEEVGALHMELAELKLLQEGLVEKLHSANNIPDTGSVDVCKLKEDLEMQTLLIQELRTEVHDLSTKNMQLQTKLTAGTFEARFIELTIKEEHSRKMNRSEKNRLEGLVKRKNIELVEAHNMCFAKDEEIKKLKACIDDLHSSMREIAQPVSLHPASIGVQEPSTEVVEVSVPEGNMDSTGNVLPMTRTELLPLNKQFSTYSLALTGGVTPCSKLPEPGSIEKNVKLRTDVNDRKPKIFSPECNVGFAEANPITCDMLPEPEQYPGGKYPEPYPGLNIGYEAARKTTPHIHECIQECWETGGPGYDVYMGPKENMTEIGSCSVEQAMRMLEHGRVDDCVIDACGELYRRVYGAKFPSFRNAMTFPARIWGEMQRENSALLRRWVDEGLEQLMSVDEWYFPLNPCTKKVGNQLHGDHWVLLKYNVTRHEWKYYNSMPPRSQGSTDPCYTKAIQLVRYVEGHLAKIYTSKKTNHILATNPQILSVVVVVPSCTQMPDSLDCGVIVLNNMYHLMKKLQIKRGEFSVIMSGNFRKKLVELIMDPLSAVD